MRERVRVVAQPVFVAPSSAIHRVARTPTWRTRSVLDMVSTEGRVPSACPSCSGPSADARLCLTCRDAFRIARNAHPTAVNQCEPEGSRAYDALADDDLDLWDAWAVLGDVGAGPAKGA